MNAKIDIVTPSGKSLEKFPQNIHSELFANTLQGAIGMIEDWEVFYPGFCNPTLHPGDKIIIEILSDK